MVRESLQSLQEGWQGTGLPRAYLNELLRTQVEQGFFSALFPLQPVDLGRAGSQQVLEEGPSVGRDGPTIPGTAFLLATL